MEWVEKTANSVAEAKEAALDALGVHEDEADFEIVNEEKTGMFGRVKEQARVRARVRPTTPRAKDDRQRRNRGGGRGKNRKGGQGRKNGGESQQQASNSRGGSRQGEKSPKKHAAQAEQSNKSKQSQRSEEKRANNDKGDQKMNDEPTMPLPEQADLAEDFVRGLAEAMETSVEFSREQVEDDEIRITVTGENIGRLIGQRGTAAMAVDDLVRTVLQRHGSSRDGRIRVDIGGLRARRAEALGAFAREQAAAVRSDGVARALEPMGGADRKIVHDALSGESGVETTSEGEDMNRRVVIVPAGDAD